MGKKPSQAGRLQPLRDKAGLRDELIGFKVTKEERRTIEALQRRHGHATIASLMRAALNAYGGLTE